MDEGTVSFLSFRGFGGPRTNFIIGYMILGHGVLKRYDCSHPISMTVEVVAVAVMST